MAIIILIIGLLVGSFLNVVAYRIPRGESIVLPPSHCPHCGSKLRPLDLVPVFSYFFLKGKCRYCPAAISRRYPLIESLTAFVFLLLYFIHGFQPLLLHHLLLAMVLIVITVTDLEQFLIPDKITFFGLVAGVASNIIFGFHSWSQMLLGVGAGAGILLFMEILSLIILKRSGMGMGDIKLAGVIGVFLGWQNVLLSLFLASVVGGVAGVYLILSKVKGRKDEIPFGPYIALGTLLTICWGEALMAWYISLFV